MKILNLADGKFTALVREQDELSEKARRSINATFEDLASNPAYIRFVTEMDASRTSGVEVTGLIAAEEMAKHGVDVIAMRKAQSSQADARLINSIVSWTLEDDEGNPVAVTLDNILGLPGKVYDELLIGIGVVEEPLDVTPTTEPGFPTPTPDSSAAS